MIMKIRRLNMRRKRKLDFNGNLDGYSGISSDKTEENAINFIFEKTNYNAEGEVKPPPTLKFSSGIFNETISYYNYNFNEIADRLASHYGSYKQPHYSHHDQSEVTPAPIKVDQEEKIDNMAQKYKSKSPYEGIYIKNTKDEKSNFMYDINKMKNESRLNEKLEIINKKVRTIPPPTHLHNDEIDHRYTFDDEPY